MKKKPLCGACPIVGYCGFLNKLLTQKKRALQSSNLRRQSSTWSILRRCDGRPARCEPGGSETPEVHRANSHSTGRNGQRAPARRRGRKRPARSDGTRSSDARGVARRGADGVVHSYDTRVPPTSAICSERRSDGAALPRLSRCAWRRAAARRQNPSQEARRRPRSTVKCTSFAAPAGHSLLVRSCVCRLLFCTPLERVERTVDLAATRCAVLGARGGGLEPAAATAWMRCVPVHQNEKSNRRSRSWRQPARA